MVNPWFESAETSALSMMEHAVNETASEPLQAQVDMNTEDSIALLVNCSDASVGAVLE